MPPWVVILAIITGIIGSVTGYRKGYPVWGFFLGLLLPVIGLVVIAWVKPDREVLVKRKAAELRVEEEARRRAGR